MVRVGMGRTLVLLLLCALATCEASRLARVGSMLVLKKRNVAVGASAFGVGDAVAQRLEDSGGAKFVVDGGRMRDAVALGGVWAGVCSPQVYALGELLLPGRSMGRVLCKVGISCGILSTAGNWINMFARRVRSGTASLAETVSMVNKDLFWEVIVDDLRVWPVYDVVCFSLIPPAVRPATTAVVNAAWATYISLVAAREARTSE
tara:strand:+ start:1590 stop:2204 length:615 start_codon:yes stop_codon:yes gene_type:complete